MGHQPHHPENRYLSTPTAMFFINLSKKGNKGQDLRIRVKERENKQISTAMATSTKFCCWITLIIVEYIIFSKNRRKKMRNITILILLMVIIELILAQNFMVSLNNSLLLHQNLSGIKALNRDFEGNFFVGFESGQARKYTPTLASYSDFTVPVSVYQFNFRRTYLSSTLTSLGSVSLADSKIIVKTNNFTTIRDYNYNTNVEEEVASINSTYLNEMGFPIMVLGVSHTFHVLICNDSIIVTYRGSSTVISSYDAQFGAGVTCKASVESSFPLGANGDNITANFIFFISLSNNNVYRTTVNLLFTFNTSINHFDLSSNSVSYSLIYSSPSTVTSLLISNGVMIMQSNSTGVTSVYNINSNTMGVTSGIPLNQTFNFFYIYNAYYILQSTGLIKLSFNSGSSNLTFNALMTSLPYNSYKLSFGTSLNAFYIPGRPYIYYGGPCPGQATYSGGTCVSYNCSVSNCSSCAISQSLCSTCATGYILNQNSTCTYSNSTIISNITSNDTTTSNNTSTNINNSNSSSLIVTDLSLNFDDSLEWFLSYFINYLKILISIPTARRIISPVFYYFGIFDDIYLYQFHDRLYGETMNAVFYTLNDIQTCKWSMLNYHTVLDYFSVDMPDFYNKTDYANAYEYYPFTDENHTDVGPQGLWSNCQNFFIVALPITMTGFLFFKILFNLLFTHSVSMWFRKFNYWPFLVLLLFDGNIQQFSFYQATDWKNMFFFTFETKVIRLQTVSFGFILFIVSISLYFISYGFYEKKNRHVMDNNRNIFLGQECLIIQIGARNCYLGLMHSLLRHFSYNCMLSVLLGSEILFLTSFIVSLSFGIYKRALKMWIYIILNFIKIILILTLFVDYQNINTQAIEKLQQVLIIIEIVVFLVGFLVETYVTTKEIIETVVRMCRQRMHEEQLEQRKKYLKKALSYSGATVFVKDFNESITQRPTTQLKIKKFFKVKKEERSDLGLNEPDSRFPMKTNYRIKTCRRIQNLRVQYEQRSPQCQIDQD